MRQLRALLLRFKGLFLKDARERELARRGRLGRLARHASPQVRDERRRRPAHQVVALEHDGATWKLEAEFHCRRT